MNSAQPILELIRGSIVEATHLGSIAIVDSTGKLLHSHGDPETVAFLRSSAKPFQALPFVEQGGVEHYNYTQAEIALSCSSHETAQLHLDTVQGMQKKIGIEESNLQCGPHLPGDPTKLKEVIIHDIHPTANFNNCSGKHTSMLAFAKMRGLPLENYLALNTTNKSDLISDINPGIRIEGSGGRSKLRFDYQLHNLIYAQDSSRNNTQNALNAFGTLEALENWFFIAASGVISQQSISAFGGATSTTVNTNANNNTTETSTYRISPYFRGSFGSLADYQLRYNLSSTSSKSNSGFDSDTIILNSKSRSEGSETS